MSGDFLDSNVVLYAFQPGDQRYQRARDIIARSISGQGQISFQVVQEVLNVLTRRPDPPLDAFELHEALLDVLAPMWRVQPSHGLYERALDVQQRYQYSFYDSLIIAAALEANCDRLLTEDLQHGQRIEGLVIENPFLT